MKKSSELDLDFSFFDWQIADVKDQVKALKQLKEDLYKNIFKIKKGERTFVNTMLALDNFSREYSRLASRVSTVMNLHTDKKMREVSQKVEVEIGKIAIEIDSNYKLFKAVESYLEDDKMQVTENLDDVQKYIIKEAKLGYKRSGMLLPAKQRSLLRQKRRQLQKLESDYSLEYNLNFSKGLWIKEEDLLGVPSAIISNWQSRLKEGSRQRFVKYVDRSALMSYCEVRETRLQFYNFSQTLGNVKNLKRLQQAVILRHEIASMLGYKTYEQYALETELVNTPNALDEFLASFDASIYKAAKSDWQKIYLEAKYLNIKKVQPWDIGYITKSIEEKRSNISSEVLAEHLEYTHVLQTIFNIFQSVFGVKVARVAADKKLFDESVSLYEWSDFKTGNILGHSLMDLFPREGKYGHFCVSWCDLNKLGGKYNSRVLIANFQVMEKGGKRLLSYSDVNGLLHEMGHMLHSMVDSSPYIATWMFAVSNDFVEIPSQLMECFWEEDKYVKEFLRHYQTGKSLPPDKRSLIAQKNNSFFAKSFAGSFNMVMMDRCLHGKDFNQYINSTESLRKLGSKTFSKVSKGLKLEPHKDQMLLANFGHIMGGYQSKYYSYLASYAYMREVWESFKSSGINRKSGERYKTLMLSVAATKGELEILQDYLGSKPTLKNFKKFADNLK